MSLLLLLLLATLAGSAASARCPTYPGHPFFTDDIIAATQRRYDYIVVGGGASGCPMATTLSKYFDVLLVERGGTPYCVPNLELMDGVLWSLKHGYNELQYVAEPFTSEDGVPNVRGRVLGGGTALNMGFYTRASVDLLRAAGLDPDRATRAYDWAEGLLAHRPRLKQWQTLLRDALLEANVRPYNAFSFDHVAGTKIGASLFDWKDVRHSSADLLAYANRENIKVLLNTTALKILFGDGPQATGVQLMDQKGVMRSAVLRAGGEVIVSAGAIGSPQLLMLSGIGPAAALRDLGVLMRVDNPWVGRGMADNPRHDVGVFTRTPIEPSLVQVVGITDSGVFIEGFSMVLVSANASAPAPRHTYLGKIFTKTNGPLSTGELRLRSADPLETPSVRFNYFQDAVDLERCVVGLRYLSDILRTPTMRALSMKNVPAELVELAGNVALPANMSEVPAVERYCRENLKTIWHYHGGCLLGSVVDEDFRVLGLQNVRVVDTSTLNFTPGANPQATTMMLGIWER